MTSQWRETKKYSFRLLGGFTKHKHTIWHQTRRTLSQWHAHCRHWSTGNHAISVNLYGHCWKDGLSNCIHCIVTEETNLQRAALTSPAQATVRVNFDPLGNGSYYCRDIQVVKAVVGSAEPMCQKREAAQVLNVHTRDVKKIFKTKN